MLTHVSKAANSGNQADDRKGDIQRQVKTPTVRAKGLKIIKNFEA